MQTVIATPRPRRFSDAEAEEIRWYFQEWGGIAGLRSASGGIPVGAASAEKRAEDASRRCRACGGWPADWRKEVRHRERTPATCPECFGEGVPLQTAGLAKSRQGGMSLEAKTPAYAEPGKRPLLQKAAKLRRILAKMGERSEDGALLVTVLWRFYGPRSPGDAAVLVVDPTEGPRWHAPSEHPKPKGAKAASRKVWGPAKVRVVEGKAEQYREEEEKGDGEARRYLAFREFGSIVEYTAISEDHRADLAGRVASEYDRRFPEVSPEAHLAKAYREVTRADGARRLAAIGAKVEKDAAIDEAKELLARACSAYRAAKRELREETR